MQMTILSTGCGSPMGLPMEMSNGDAYLLCTIEKMFSELSWDLSSLIYAISCWARAKYTKMYIYVCMS